MRGRRIEIRGARTHHLKDLSLDLPREAWTVVCGVSGSGKSSLVLDTLGAESRRRFLGVASRGAAGEAFPRPDVDRIEGLPPAVVAGFGSRAPGPRATLGTLTEVHDGLRVLFARAAAPHCPTCGGPVGAVAPERVVAALLERPAGTRVVLTAPRGTGPRAVERARRDGFVRVRVAGGEPVRLEDVDLAAVAPDAAIEVVVDRLVVRPDARGRFAEAVEQGFRQGAGVLRAIVDAEGAPRAEETFSDRPFCARCGLAYPPLSPSLFSFDSPAGACPACEGLGVVPALDPEQVLPRSLSIRRAAARLSAAVAKADRPIARHALLGAAESAGLEPRDLVARLPEGLRAKVLGTKGRKGVLALVRARPGWTRFASWSECGACGGSRLAPFPSAARLEGARLPDLLATAVADLRPRLLSLALPGSEGALARPVRDDVAARLAFLEEVGLGYLRPDRAARTLSGGELRRARLAAACAARMSGLLYLLDEPTAGLHPADRAPLRARLRALVGEGNTVVCVEHDPAVLADADHVLELGPGAGVDGGRILAQGPSREVLAKGEAPIARAAMRPRPPPREAPRREGAGAVRVVGARFRNLRGVDASFPVAALTCVTGVSGAGKSTLVLDVLAPAARAALGEAPFPEGRLERLEGLAGFDRVSVSDGAPSRHPRASPGSVLGVLDALREVFAATVEARARGYGPSRFSTQVPGGRCEACNGTGLRAVRLRHLPDLEVPCDVCEGRRFKAETLDVRVKGLSVADVLDLPLSRAAEVFRDLRVADALRAAVDVGLGYVRLGEPTHRLSGGEALRLRLAAALGRRGRTRTLYLLDEPCSGLHPDDVENLSRLLLRLSAEGDAVVAVEHHPDLVRLADHVVDLGPGPGEAGGRVVVEGPPAAVARSKASATGRSLGGAPAGKPRGRRAPA